MPPSMKHYAQNIYVGIVISYPRKRGGPAIPDLGGGAITGGPLGGRDDTKSGRDGTKTGRQAQILQKIG